MSAAARPKAALGESVIRQASEWFVRMDAEDTSAGDRAAWQHWLNADPLHRLAWERVERLGQQFCQIEPQAGLVVLDRPRSRSRRQLLKVFSLTMGAGALAATCLPWEDWTSDVTTRVGERRSAELTDGSIIMLNTDSAVDSRFTATERLIVLRRGEVHIASHKDPFTPTRPLVVTTPMGRITALGTRFVVRLMDGNVWVAVTEGAVRIEPKSGNVPFVVDAGAGAYFDAGVVQPVQLAAHADDWVQGALFADNMRLGDFVAELSRYRAGRMVCDPSIADLRISGSYPLDDTDRILAAVERALPVRVQRYTRYWVVLRGKD